MSPLPAVTLALTNWKDFTNESVAVSTSLCAAERSGEPLAQCFLIVFIFFMSSTKGKRNGWRIVGSHYRAHRPVLKPNAGLSAASRSSGALGHLSSVGLCKEHLRGPDVCPGQNSFGFLCVSPEPLF